MRHAREDAEREENSRRSWRKRRRDVDREMIPRRRRRRRTSTESDHPPSPPYGRGRSWYAASSDASPAKKARAEEEDSEFAAEVSRLRASIADEMREILADHAATELQYAEHVRRKAEMPSLTVETYFCDIHDGSSQSCKARKVALLASKSVVSLSAFSDEKRIRVCSGFVIGSDRCTNTSKILTSATLLRTHSSSGVNFMVPDIKVKVCLPNGHISDGLVSMLDFHYNLAVVEVKSDQELPDAILVSEVTKRGAVLAIGRFYDHGGMMCAQGKITKQASAFDCSELFVSSCQTTMAGVGGPLVNYSGHVVGINFHGENHTPFLSTAIIVRCLEHWQNYGEIIRPWLGFMYTSLDMLPLRVLEKCEYADEGFYISNVAKGSPADAAGLCVGDVLIECAGEVLCTAPEFGALLLDMCKEQMETYNSASCLTVEVVVVRKQRDGSRARKTMKANVLREPDYYRWPAPSPSYNHKIVARKSPIQLL